MFKEKERLFHWFYKFAPRKKVGMLLLCAVSALVFGWVLYVGKGEDTHEGIHILSMGVNNTSDLNYPGYLSPNVDQVIFSESNSSILNNEGQNIAQPPPPPAYFTGYTLPPGNPCESFTLPPPPADKKRTGPRPCPVCYLPVEEAIALMPKAPSFSPIIQNLTYISEEYLTRSEFGGSEFGGYPSLEQRTDSYDIRESMSVHCGYDFFLGKISLFTSSPRSGCYVPKLLLHRLFPYARYSLWIDGKLELVVDPYQLLERFLWRKNASFAISRHYRRFDVFVEAEANKVAAKFDNESIDFQIDFYRREGLTPYSEAKLPITSDVPEGCVIIKEHIPFSNLFTCLWFNEVDRFTPRDQISFSTVRDKIMSKTNWTVNMFLDCERRNFVVQGYHRDVLEHWAPPPPPLPGAKTY